MRRSSNRAPAAVTVRVVQRIAGVTDAVTVRVFLTGIRDRRAVVRSVGHAVTIGIGQRVAGVTDTVTVRVFLAGVRGRRAVVDGAAQSVAIGVVRRVTATRIASVAVPVAVDTSPSSTSHPVGGPGTSNR